MISIIMPTYNRFDVVKETIQKAIAAADGIDSELIVVNDGKDLPFSITHPKLSIFKNPQKGVAYARNFGAAKSKYPILFFIDDDMWITKESIDSLQSLYENHFFQRSCVVLNWEYPAALQEKMKSEKIGRYLLSANYHTLEGRAKIIVDHRQLLFKVTSIGSGSFAISKNVFNEIGGYNENITFQGEDIELSQALNRLGISIFLYTPVTCLHNQKDRLDLNGLLDRERRGYESQFKNNRTSAKINKIKLLVFICLMPLEHIIEWLFQKVPNTPTFDRLNFRLTGILTSIVYYKAWWQSKP